LIGGDGLLAIRVADAAGWMSFAAMGAVSAAIYLAVATALSLANTSVLASLQYLEIRGATLLGFVVFGRRPMQPHGSVHWSSSRRGFTPFVANDRCRGYCST
jgi:drug/metabolite transporter (DMT)-like permease